MEGGSKEDLKILEMDPKELEMEALMKAEEHAGKVETDEKANDTSTVGMTVSRFYLYIMM